MAVAGAQFQSEQRFGISLALTQSPNLILMVAALVVVVTGIKEARLPLAISALGFVLAGVIGWWTLFRERAAKPHRETWFPWTEALSYAGLNATGLLLVQLDRLIIPQVLTLHDLATYGVLAAIAGSLFRVLQMGAAYTLIPRLRAADSVAERRRLIAQEARLVSAIVVAGSVAIWFVTPLIERHFLAGKYHLGGSLLLAALFSGVAKVMNAFTKSTVTALATAGELSIVNLFGWVSVAVAVVAAVAGARWGLPGVIYGVGLGWLLRALTALYLTLRHLKLPESIPATAR
jgi:O-antigen/teichoic acid export membrane protein